MTDHPKDLLDKLKAVEKRRAMFASGCARPGETVIERVLGPCEVVINGKATLMFGSNNYLGLTLEPAVVAAARDALLEYGTGTTGSRTANGTLSLHEDLERELADWFHKRHALIFSTGYQANLSIIGGLCGVDDIIQVLTGDAEEWKQRAAQRPDPQSNWSSLIPLVLLLFLFGLIFFFIIDASRRSKGRHPGGGVTPWIGGWSSGSSW